MGITKNHFYKENSSDVKELLRDMAETPFESVSLFKMGTELKLQAVLKDNKGKVLMKPMRYSREKSASYFFIHLSSVQFK